MSNWIRRSVGNRELAPPPFVGRSAQLEAVALEAGKEDQEGCVICLPGRSGHGVTRFLETSVSRLRTDFRKDKRKFAILEIDGVRLCDMGIFEFIVRVRNQFVLSKLVSSRMIPIEKELAAFDTLAKVAANLFDLRQSTFSRSRSAAVKGRIGKALLRIITAGVADLVGLVKDLAEIGQAAAEEALDAGTEKARKKLRDKIAARLAALGSGPAAAMLKKINGGWKPRYRPVMEALQNELFKRIGNELERKGPVQLVLVVDAFDLAVMDEEHGDGRLSLKAFAEESMRLLGPAAALVLVGYRSDQLTYIPAVAGVSTQTKSIDPLRWTEISATIGEEKCECVRNFVVEGKLLGRGIPAVEFARAWQLAHAGRDETGTGR